MEKQPAYRIIQKDILDAIADGSLAPDARIATESELMARYGVSRITVQNALAGLKARGVLERTPRLGTFVARKEETESVPGRRINPGRLSIGVVVTFDLERSQTYRYLNGILSRLQPSRDSLRLRNTNGDRDLERVMLENCLEEGCDGILYYPGRTPAPPVDLMLRIAARGIPCVLMDKQAYGVPLPCVQTDNVAAGADITREMIRRGHRKLAFVQGGFESPVRERYLGFLRAKAEEGLDITEDDCVLVRRDGDEQEMKRVAEELVFRGYTGVCCVADSFAEPLLKACGSAGIDVPGTLAVGSIDGALPGVVTSMLQPYEEIGAAAAEILLRWILEGKVRRETVCLPASLLPGRTV